MGYVATAEIFDLSMDHQWGVFLETEESEDTTAFLENHLVSVV
jgi:hypothetical protein